MRVLGCVIVLLIAGAACTPVVCGCAPPVQAIVWGQVTVDTGGAASFARINASAVRTGAFCVQGTMYGWGRADSLGRYRIFVFGAGITDSGCVFVGARFPPQGSNARDTVLGPYKVGFLPDPPFDSLHVDIVVRH